MSLYHIIIEANDYMSVIEEKRDIALFNIEDLKQYLHSILLPLLNHEMIELEDENLQFKDIVLFKIYSTQMPIEYLIEEEQKELPSDTDITITANEIFNDRELSHDVTSVIFDVLDAAKIDRENF